MTLPELIIAIDDWDVGQKVLVVYFAVVFVLMSLLVPVSIVLAIFGGLGVLVVALAFAYRGWKRLVRWARGH